jgi:hypothetical protein
MQTKLTLRLDAALIEAAKARAAREGTSLSRLVAAYFRGLTEPDAERRHPWTEQLVGAACPDRDDGNDNADLVKSPADDDEMRALVVDRLAEKHA